MSLRKSGTIPECKQSRSKKNIWRLGDQATFYAYGSDVLNEMIAAQQG